MDRNEPRRFRPATQGDGIDGFYVFVASLSGEDAGLDVSLKTSATALCTNETDVALLSGSTYAFRSELQRVAYSSASCAAHPSSS